MSKKLPYQLIQCFNCHEQLGVYEHTSRETGECLQIHICLKCKLSGVKVEVYAETSENKKFVIERTE